MNVVLTRLARRDLDEAYNFIARDNPQAAEQVLGRLNAAFQRLADGELSDPEVRLRSGRQARHWTVPPYRIYWVSLIFGESQRVSFHHPRSLTEATLRDRSADHAQVNSYDSLWARRRLTKRRSGR